MAPGTLYRISATLEQNRYFINWRFTFKAEVRFKVEVRVKAGNPVQFHSDH